MYVCIVSMNNKLTLKLDQQVIEQAKIYAKNKNTSLSKLVESYLQILTSDANTREEITPLVKSLSGVLELKEDEDLNAKYKNHLNKKYNS